MKLVGGELYIIPNTFFRRFEIPFVVLESMWDAEYEVGPKAWSLDDDVMSDGMICSEGLWKMAFLSVDFRLRVSSPGFLGACSSVKDHEDGVQVALNYICCCASCRLCSISGVYIGRLLLGTEKEQIRLYLPSILLMLWICRTCKRKGCDVGGC